MVAVGRMSCSRRSLNASSASLTCERVSIYGGGDSILESHRWWWRTAIGSHLSALLCRGSIPSSIDSNATGEQAASKLARERGNFSRRVAYIAFTLLADQSEAARFRRILVLAR